MAAKRYKVTNTTRKVRPVEGPDSRTNLQKNGYRLSLKNENGDSAVLVPGGKPVITNHLDQRLIELHSLGDILIEEFGDLAKELEAFTLAPDRPTRAALNPLENNSRVSLTGHENHSPQSSGREMEGAVNPDGDPNFLVKTKEVKRVRRGEGAQEVV